MAIDVKRDIFEPTQRAIEQIEQERTCSYCKSYNKGFSAKDNTCNCCGAPGPNQNRKVYYVDVGNSKPKEVESYIKGVKAMLKAAGPGKTILG